MSKKDRFKNLLDRNDGNESNSVKEEIFIDIQKNINTEIQETVTKKKATFEFDSSLHTQLKVFAAQQGKKMVEIVEAAVKEYIEKQS